MTTVGKRSSATAGQEIERGSMWRNVFWLAGKELQRTWLSYLATVVLAALYGAFAAVALLGALPVGTPPNIYASAAVDIFFVFGVSALATNALSKDYLYSWGDTFSKRLRFLRSLPVSAEELVVSRVLTMLVALFLNSVAFLVTIYLLSASVGDRLVAQLGFGEYLSFAGIWAGYAVFCSGAWMYGEFGLNGRTYNNIVFGVMGFAFIFLIFLEWLFKLRIVERSIYLAGNHGPLPAILTLLLGGVAFALWSRAAVRKIKRRDLTA